MFEFRSQLIEDFSEKIKLAKLATGDIYAIPNIAITFNNKIVELYHIFERKNKEALESKLFSLIYNHLLISVFKLDMIFKDMLLYVRKSSADPDIESKADELFNTMKGFIDEYKKLDDSVFYFDIEKNIMDAYNTEVQRQKEIQEDGGLTDFILNRESVINTYNEELKEMGYKVQIEEKQKTKQGL